MPESLREPDNPMFYLDHTTGVMADLCQITASECHGFQEKEQVRDVFGELMKFEKIPALATYVVSEIGKECSLVIQENVDSGFFLCTLIFNDTADGRLQIANVDLSERLDADDFIFMNPRVLHSIYNAPRDEKHNIVVFTF